MRLSQDEQAMADGRRGPALEFAIGLIIKAGDMHGAERLQEIEAAYVNTTFGTIEPHYDLLRWLVDNKAAVSVPTYTNVSAYDADNPKLRSDTYGQWAAERSRALMDLHKQIGCRLALTCAPYQLPGRPTSGAHIAVSESNAVSYFNSVVGARTLKYGDYLDMAAALTGRVPYMGLHTDEGRRATLVLDIEALPEAFASDDLSYQLIGHAMGRKAGMDIPVLLNIPQKATPENLRAISATGAAAGGVAMYHAVGLTPEAPTLDTATGGREPVKRDTISISLLKSAKAELTQFDKGTIDAVVVGTPHASLAEVGLLAKLIEGRSIKAGLFFYIQMNRYVLERAREKGWIGTLKSAGVTPVADTCLYWRPNVHGLDGRVMTNSGKFAYYAPGELKLQATIGSLRECVESAVRGEVWTDPDMAIGA